MLLPIHTSSIYNRNPIANWSIIAITIVVSIWGGITIQLNSSLPDWFDAMMLDGWGIEGVFGHVLLHAGFLHLAGNMLFLWVFGNTVCSKTGSLWYLVIYLCCGVGAAITHNLFSAGPAIGASGAINGIIGFYLILQPVNHVEMFYFIFFMMGRFNISGYWIIILWFLLDIWGFNSGSQGASNTAYAAHIGGFLTGIFLGCLFVLFKFVSLHKYDNPTLLEYLKIVPMGHCGGYHHIKEERSKYL